MAAALKMIKVIQNVSSVPHYFLHCLNEWWTEQPGQSRLPEPGSLWRQAAASLATLASVEAAGHL